MAQRDIKSILASFNFKATPQRLAVYDAVNKFGYASAEMVLEHIRGVGEVSITVASVYNILSQFADTGIMQKRSSLSGRTFYSIGRGTHAVLYDTRTDRFSGINDEALTAAVEAALKGRRFRGYRLDRVDIQLICHSTRRKINQNK